MKTKNSSPARNVVLAALFLALAFVLPMVTGHLPQVGNMLCPMHFPILLCGFVLGGPWGLAVGFAYAWVEPYRRERLLSFRNPFAQMSDEGYQLSQSLIAIGSGGLFGRGLGQGRQKFSYLPYPESDFIFAIIGEDFGLFGCCVVILLFVAFAVAGMRIALNCQDRYGCLLAAGITAMISVQAFINIGGGHSPNDRSSFAFFQRRRHLHFPSDGRRRHPLQYFPSCMKTLGPLRPQTLQ